MGNDDDQENGRRIWGRVAPGYAAKHRTGEANFAAVSDWLIDRADPEPGQVVLDLAAGAGGLGHRVANLVGPDGRVISTDFASEMVEIAQRLGAEQGLDNVEYRTLDAEQMELDTASIDAILCRSALMVMPDPGAALSEARRVLRPGGSLAFSTFTTPEANPWVALQGRTFLRRGLISPPEPGAPGMFSMGDPDRVRELVTGAGFDDPEIEAVKFDFRFDDADHIWSTIVDINALLGPIVKAMPPGERAEIRTAVIEGFADFRANDGSYPVPAEAQAVLAR